MEKPVYTGRDVAIQLVQELRTEARWLKAIQHLKEQGKVEDSPRDIGPLIFEVLADIQKEETEYIKDELFEFYWKLISRGVVSGFAEWYKKHLLEKVFENDQLTS